jgi:small subunit ribosomal protein S17
MQKTVVVEVEYRRRHPLYQKVLRKQRRFFAHDEENSCQEGDLVRIVETRPLSRKKRWRVAEILERAA